MTGKATRDPSTFTVIGKALIKLDMAGVVRREPCGLPVYGLTAPHVYALAEVVQLFARVERTITEAEFTDALEVDGIQPYATTSEQTLYRQRTAARQRAA